MSDSYPVDDLEWSNNNEGLQFREAILSLKQLDNNDCLSLLEALDEGGYNEVQRVAEFIGVAPDPGTAWSSLRIGELKVMLSLAAEDYDQAAEWNDWCLHMDQLSDERIRYYRALQVLLEIKRDESRDYADYTDSLKLMYGRETVDTVINVLEGKENFHGLHSPGLSLNGFEVHNKLLDGYRKLHRAKVENW